MARSDDIAKELEADAWAIPDQWNQVTSAIIASAIEVHSILGSSILERYYEEALEHELRRRGLGIDRQRTIRLPYKDILLSPMTLDLVVEGLVVVELKAVSAVQDAHLAQLLSQMKAGDLPLGLLINFHAPLIKQGLYRRINRAACEKLIPHHRPIPHFP